MLERAIIIRGALRDLSDVLRIARKLGKQALQCEKVNVLPFATIVIVDGKENYLVVVRNEN